MARPPLQHNPVFAVLAECSGVADRPWCFTDVQRRVETWAQAQAEAEYWLRAEFEVAIFGEGAEEGTSVQLWSSLEDDDGPPDQVH